MNAFLIPSNIARRLACLSGFPSANLVNKESVGLYSVLDNNWQKHLLNQLKIFHKETGSVKALNIIENFQSEVLKFVHVVPDEVKSKLLFSVESKDKIA